MDDGSISNSAGVTMSALLSELLRRRRCLRRVDGHGGGGGAVAVRCSARRAFEASAIGRGRGQVAAPLAAGRRLVLRVADITLLSGRDVSLVWETACGSCMTFQHHGCRCVVRLVRPWGQEL